MQKNAPATKIIYRAIVVAIAASTLIIAVYMYWASHAVPKQEAAVNSSTEIISTTPPIVVPPPSSPLSTAATAEQKKIPACLNTFDLTAMPHNLREMKDLFWEKIGAPEREKLQWRNIHYVESDGTKRRLRISLTDTNSGRQRYELRLYSVDEEDLPVPMESIDKERFNPTKDVLQKYIQGKEISLDSSLTNYEYANGSSLEIEQENTNIKLLRYHGREFSLGCSLDKSSGEPDCSCLQ